MTTALIEPDQAKVAQQIRKPTKKQAVLAALLRYKAKQEDKLDAIEAKNTPLIKELKKERSLKENELAELIIATAKKMGFTLKKSDITIDANYYNPIKFSKTKDGYRLESHTYMDGWKGTEEFKRLKALQKIEKDAEKLQDEIDNVENNLSADHLDDVRRRLGLHMSGTQEYSDMQVATALLEDKATSQSIDAVLKSLSGEHDTLGIALK